jgi:hypothetical protein
MKKLLIGILALGLPIALILGFLCLCVNGLKNVKQYDMNGSVMMTFYNQPWEGGARRLSDDRIGELAAKLDYTHYGFELPRNPDGFPLDIWDHPFRIRATPAVDEVGVYILEVRSAGPDGVMETSDDVVTKENIPVVYYVFRDRSDPAVTYDFALVGASVLVQKVTEEGSGQVTLYEYNFITGPLAIEAKKWKNEPGEDVADGLPEEGILMRVTFPADHAEPVRKVCFPKQNREYKEFLVRLREQCLRESCRADSLPLLVIRDARLKNFLKASWKETAPSVGPFSRPRH